MFNKNLFPYGTVLKIQREFTMDDIYRHMDKIKKLGMNFIVVWPAVFWWEERNDNYPYNTGIQILKYAEKLDINIIVEVAGQLTSLEYGPDFLMKEEYLPVNYDGSYRKEYKGFDHLNYNHPEVKQLIRKQYKEVANYYKEFSSLYGYDIWNETMFTSYDTYTLQLFREWLKNKYKNLKKLNDVWDRAYYDWSQINFDKWIWASVMPVVDYEQFHKENVGMILSEWRKIIKEEDPEHPVIADNIHSTLTQDSSYDRPQDDWNVSQNTDEMGFSFYPKNSPHMENWQRWETLTGLRSANRNKPFWISELQSHHQAMYNPGSLVHPEEIKWWNWEAISQGAKGIIYWKWAPFIKGVQTFGRGLIDYKGNYTPRTAEAEKIKKILDENLDQFNNYKPAKSNVAILYDKLNHDFSKAYSIYYDPYISNSIYLDSLAGLYKCLWEQNITSDFITPEDIGKELSDEYKVLFVSNQLNIDEGMSNSLDEFVEDGGVLIFTGRCGFINNEGILNKNIPGGEFNSQLGCTLIDVAVDGLDIKFNDNHKLQGYYEKQLLDVNDETEILASYEDGYPAVISSKKGKGEVIYIGTYLWYGYYQNESKNTYEYLNKLISRYSLNNFTLDNHQLKINYLQGEDGYIIFAFNYSDTTLETVIEFKDIIAERIQVKDLYLNEEKVIKITDNKLRFDLKVDKRDVRVYKILY